MRAPPILIVEVDRRAARLIEAILIAEGYGTALARCGEEALCLMEKKRPFLVLSEIMLPGMDGLTLLKEAKARRPDIAFIILTALRDTRTIVRAMQAGAANYVVKPFTRAALLSAVGEVRRTTEVEQASHRAAPPIIGKSEAMAEVLELIAVAQRSELNVLITGETGTGKELVARAIHRGSPRGAQELIIHNCARACEALFGTAFFGYVRGAFTGADKDQACLLERAHGSDFFLDELEALSLDHQGQILRAIEDGEARPVGASEGRKVSVRYLSATNRDLKKMMVERLFREDLYFRVSGCQIRLPPLRERAGDILLLVEHFLGDLADQVTGEAMSALEAYPWPGNVRELRNVVVLARDLAIAGGERRIDLKHVAICEPGIKEAAAASLGQRRIPEVEHPDGDGHYVHDIALDKAEKELILVALQRARGNKAEAARLLHIERKTLYAKLKRQGIEAWGGLLETQHGTEACRIDAPPVSNRHARRKRNNAG